MHACRLAIFRYVVRCYSKIIYRKWSCHKRCTWELNGFLLKYPINLKASLPLTINEVSGSWRVVTSCGTNMLNNSHVTQLPSVQSFTLATVQLALL